MTEIDLSRWPVLSASLDEEVGEADLAALLGGVESALEQRAPFVVLILAPSRLLGDKAHDAAPLRRLRRRRAEVGTWCRGVAYVLAGELGPGEQGTATRSAERLWGCPIHIGQSLDEARDWLVARL
jgi:hypothetical protein